jgi:hypothetical protein
MVGDDEFAAGEVFWGVYICLLITFTGVSGSLGF